MLIFMHIPKNGGTTLRRLISRNVSPTLIASVNEDALAHNPYLCWAPRSPIALYTRSPRYIGHRLPIRVEADVAYYDAPRTSRPCGELLQLHNAASPVRSGARKRGCKFCRIFQRA